MQRVTPFLSPIPSNVGLISGGKQRILARQSCILFLQSAAFFGGLCPIVSGPDIAGGAGTQTGGSSPSKSIASALQLMGASRQSTVDAARGLSAHFTASVCSGSSRSHFRHLNSVRPFSARTAFIRLLQCVQRVASMADLRFRANVSSAPTCPWNKSSPGELRECIQESVQCRQQSIAS